MNKNFTPFLTEVLPQTRDKTMPPLLCECQQEMEAGPLRPSSSLEGEGEGKKIIKEDKKVTHLYSGLSEF